MHVIYVCLKAGNNPLAAEDSFEEMTMDEIFNGTYFNAYCIHTYIETNLHSHSVYYLTTKIYYYSQVNISCKYRLPQPLLLQLLLFYMYVCKYVNNKIVSIYM